MASRLRKTVLWRHDIERIFAADADEAVDKARKLQPRLVLVDATTMDAAQIFRALREEPATRQISLASLGAGKRSEQALRGAGANLIVPSEFDPTLFDARLEELLDVPRRRETRLAASFQLWCRSELMPGLTEAVVLNISVRGMLIETKEPLPLGTTVELQLPLPDDGPPLPLMGLVERQVDAPDGRYRTGVQFLILRDEARERIRAFIEAEAP
jgi:hypothetical protein